MDAASRFLWQVERFPKQTKKCDFLDCSDGLPQDLDLEGFSHWGNYQAVSVLKKP